MIYKIYSGAMDEIFVLIFFVLNDFFCLKISDQDKLKLFSPQYIIVYVVQHRAWQKLNVMPRPRMQQYVCSRQQLCINNGTFFSVLFINNINNANVIVFQRHWFSVSHQKRLSKKPNKFFNVYNCLQCPLMPQLHPPLFWVTSDCAFSHQLNPTFWYRDKRQKFSLMHKLANSWRTV